METRTTASGVLMPQPGQMLPGFELPSSRGGSSGPWRYKGRRALVLALVHSEGCDECRRLLVELAERYRDYVEEEAEVLAVAALPAEEATRLAGELRLPYPLLADATGEVHRRYGALAQGQGAGLAVLVADRFGEVAFSWLAGEGHGAFPGHTALLEHLRFLGIQCPE